MHGFFSSSTSQLPLHDLHLATPDNRILTEIIVSTASMLKFSLIEAIALKLRASNAWYKKA